MNIIKRTFLFMSLCILSMFLHIEVLFGIGADQLKQHEGLVIFIELAIWLFLLLLFTKLVKHPFFKEQEVQFSFFNGINWKKTAITLAMFAIALFIGYLDDQYNPSTLPENQQIINQYYLQVPLLVSISNYLFAPTIEELLFRGIFFKLFFPKKTRLNTVLRMFVSGIVFGFAHQFTVDINWLIYCLMGWLLAITFYSTKELAYPMGLHLLVNLV